MSAKKMIQTVGRRKTAIARVHMSAGDGKVTVNGKEIDQYFTVPRMLKWATEGLDVSGLKEKYNFNIRVSGGGVGGQAGAVRLGLARALQRENESLHSEFKKAGMLTRDPRMVERKKYGFRKARRGTQFSKR
jgi:small subunit ribosomal protein S9